MVLQKTKLLIDIGPNHIVINNECYNNQENGIDLTSGTDIIVEGNILHDNHEADLMLNYYVSNVKIRRNFIYSGNHHGIQIYGCGSGITLENNIIYDPHYCTFEVGANPCESITLYNNTFVSTENSERSTIRIWPGANKVIAKNNIIESTAFNKPGKLILFGNSATPQNTNSDFSHNVWWRPDGNIVIPNELLDQGSLISDPQLVNPEKKDFHIQNFSPCIDTGIDVGISKDFEGNEIPQGFAPDIGAYEYAGSSNSLSAKINASPTSGYAPLSVNFTASASGGKSPYSYSWKFGDGQSSSLQNPSHTFNSGGTYTVTLTVTDSTSNTATDSLTINVQEKTSPLTASAGGSPTSGHVPLSVSFTGSASGGKSPYSYSWDFGDGSTSSSQNPSHTYSTAGTYTVTLTVTDSNTTTATDSLTITATSPPPAEANLSISSSTGSPAPGSGGTTDPSPGNHSYAVGSSVQVKAEAEDDYRFAKWSGDVGGSDLYKAQIIITMNKNKSVSAHFYTKCGDVNGDLSITPADAQAAFDIFLGKISNPTESELENSDVNCDGTKTEPSVTPADAQAIFEKFLGKSNLPCSCSAASRASTLSGRIEEAGNINLIISDIQAAEGEEIVVPIIVDDCFHLKSFGFDLIFPTDALEFVGVERSKYAEDFEKLDANMIAEGVVRAGGYKNKAFQDYR